MEEVVLEVNSLTKIFKSKGKTVRALDNVSFQIRKGSITGFVGPNGSGKTTTIKCVLGLMKKTSGTIRIFGQDYLSDSVKRRIGYMPEKDAFYEDMTAFEYLYFLARLSGMSDDSARSRADELINLLGLQNARDRAIKGFSSGMKKKTLFAQAIIHNPDLIILDEPTANLDPMAQKQVGDILKELAEKGATIFISSHHIEELGRIVDHLVIIKNSKLLEETDVRSITSKKTALVISFEDSIDAKYAFEKMKLVFDDISYEKNKIRLYADDIIAAKNRVKEFLKNKSIVYESLDLEESSGNLWDYVLKVLERN